MADTPKHETGDDWTPGDPTQRYDEVVFGRKSIRGYLDKPVPMELMQEVISLAMRSPSSMNTQPWHFHVITGKPLDEIRQGNTERILAGEPDSREFRTGKAFANEHRDRQIEVAKQLFAEMQIARGDADAAAGLWRAARRVVGADDPVARGAALHLTLLLSVVFSSKFADMLVLSIYHISPHAFQTR